MAKRSRTADKSKEAEPASPMQRGEIRIEGSANSPGDIVLLPTGEEEVESPPPLVSINEAESALDEILAGQNAPIPYWASALVDLGEREHFSITRPFNDASRIFEPALKSHQDWLIKDAKLQDRSDDRLCLIQLGLEIPSSLASEYRDKASSLGEDHARHKSELQSLNSSFLSHFESHWKESYSSFDAKFKTAFLGEQTTVRIKVRVIANPTSSWVDILGIAPLLLRSGEECYDESLKKLKRHYNIAPGRNDPTAEEIAGYIVDLSDDEFPIALRAVRERLQGKSILSAENATKEQRSAAEILINHSPMLTLEELQVIIPQLGGLQLSSLEQTILLQERAELLVGLAGGILCSESKPLVSFGVSPAQRTSGQYYWRTEQMPKRTTDMKFPELTVISEKNETSG